MQSENDIIMLVISIFTFISGNEIFQGVGILSVLFNGLIM